METAGPLRRERNLVRGVLPMRSIGLLAGALAVGTVLHEQSAPWPWWALMAFNVLVWPTLAYWRAQRQPSPLAAEHQHLVIDSAFGGLWMAAMHFNLMPSALLLATLTMDKLAFGGWTLVARALLAMALAALATSALLGFPVQLETSQAAMRACIPHLVIYPLIISSATYGLLRRVTQQAIELTALGRRDGLTDVATRQHWEECAEQEIRRSRRMPVPASLLIVDLDHFKRINDSLGHAVGDDVLRHLAHTIGQSVREVDTVGRYGGDEFVVLLPNAGIATARAIAERLLGRLAASVAQGTSPAAYSISVGAAELDPATPELREWFSRADQALYRAKQRGRGQVVSDGLPPAPNPDVFTPAA